MIIDTEVPTFPLTKIK